MLLQLYFAKSSKRLACLAFSDWHWRTIFSCWSYYSSFLPLLGTAPRLSISRNYSCIGAMLSHSVCHNTLLQGSLFHCGKGSWSFTKYFFLTRRRSLRTSAPHVAAAGWNVVGKTECRVPRQYSFSRLRLPLTPTTDTDVRVLLFFASAWYAEII